MDEHGFTISLGIVSVLEGLRALQQGLIVCTTALGTRRLSPKLSTLHRADVLPATLQLEGSRRAALSPWAFFWELHHFPAGELDTWSPSPSQQPVQSGV